MVCDALPPVTFDLGRPGWAPTLELTVHVRAVPAPGWLKVSHRTRNVAGGMFEEDCEVWDSAGRLVAQSRRWQCSRAADMHQWPVSRLETHGRPGRVAGAPGS